MLKLHIQIHAGTHSHAHTYSHTETHTCSVAHIRRSHVRHLLWHSRVWGGVKSAAFLPTFCFPLAQIMIPRHIPSHFNAPPLCCSPLCLPPPFSLLPTAFFLCSLVAFVVAAYLLQRLFAMPRCHCVSAGVEVAVRVRRGAADRVYIVWSLCLQQITLLAQHFNVRD